MTHKHLALAILIAALTACSTPSTLQYAIDTPTVTEGKAARTTVEVLEVSLPLYAESQEIPLAEASGAIRTDASSLWADTPTRAISINLAESLSKMTRTVAAVEPWPLEDAAQAKLDVRVKTLLASVRGSLQFSGQYFIVYDTGRAPTAQWFDITVPLTGQGGSDISAATGIAVNELAQRVANDLR